ncbi:MULTISPECIES: permease-like cell division protein FtsX [Clostridiaceae]|uniref:Cell division protein FtsX n=1 Tax=Clostridium facile TaxID=2763035 RepID=A0ABR7IMP6_9CLOT|nr:MULTISPECIES: permease-like cell division protein FtsX [Clostridiaceae]MBC5786421.1 ABC transporter permease [Clostridium facile]
MRGSSIKYLAKEGIRNVWINRLMSFASIGVLTACLMLVGLAVLLTANMDSMIGFVEEQSTIEIFLKDDATQEDVDQLTNELDSLEFVESTTYISKEQALRDYADRLNNKELYDSIVNDNFLPASLRVSVSDLTHMEDITKLAEQSPAYDSYKIPTNVAKTITDLKQTVTWFGVVIVAALVVVSLVIISNTIRATVFARRKEIGIMKQVGATNNFIRVPFLFEGICLGIVSAIVAFLLIWGGYEAIIHIIKDNSSAFLQSMYDSIIPFGNIGWKIAIAFFLAGCATGALGSVISLRTHLKV